MGFSIGAADARNGLVLDPTRPSPLDAITAIGPGRIFVQSVNGGMHITGHMAQNEIIHVNELNVSGVFSSGCVYQSDTAAGGANLTGDRISIDFLHGMTAGETVDLQIVASSSAAATVMNYTSAFTTP